MKRIAVLAHLNPATPRHPQSREDAAAIADALENLDAGRVARIILAATPDRETQEGDPYGPFTRAIITARDADAMVSRLAAMIAAESAEPRGVALAAWSAAICDARRRIVG